MIPFDAACSRALVLELVPALGPEQQRALAFERLGCVVDGHPRVIRRGGRWACQELDGAWCPSTLEAVDLDGMQFASQKALVVGKTRVCHAPPRPSRLARLRESVAIAAYHVAIEASSGRILRSGLEEQPR